MVKQCVSVLGDRGAAGLAEDLPTDHKDVWNEKCFKTPATGLDLRTVGGSDANAHSLACTGIH